MPIKEIMTFGFGVLAVLFVTHGPLHFRKSILKLQAQILHELGSASNWGDPSLPFHRTSHRGNRSYKKGSSSHRKIPVN